MEYIFDKRDIPIPPVISGEICMCFNYDFDINIIDNIIGIKASEAVRKSKTRFNTIIKDNNPGYWSYKIRDFNTFECGELANNINEILLRNYSGFMMAYYKYRPTDFFVRMLIGIKKSGEYPAIGFDKKVLETFAQMGIRIDISVYNDFFEQ